MKLSGLFVLLLAAAPAWAQPITLHWLDPAAPPLAEGVSWGVPWPQGAVNRQTNFALTDSKGQSIPVQTWVTAWWPDGSVKWTGNAIAASPDIAGPLSLAAGPSAAPKTAITVSDDAQSISINTGPMICRISKSGRYLIDSITLGNRVVADHGELVCSLEDRSQFDTQHILRDEDFASAIDAVTVEQSGPVRAVVKITGQHKSLSGDRAFLPFVVRLYFYAGLDSIKMVHTFIFDGDQEKDFIHSLGVRFGVPLREELQNRHVRLAGDSGMLTEAVRWLAGRRDPSQADYELQLAGKRVPNLAQLARLRQGATVGEMASWDGFKLTQINDGGYVIQKRTNPKSAWINVTAGHHSEGLAFFGDVSGGLAVSLQNFWQLSPTEMEIEGAAAKEAELTMWLWSPESPAMDLRHYDIKANGLEASYEDVQPGLSTATGIARTSVLMIRAFDQVPSDTDLQQAAVADQKLPLLVCAPEYYHSIPIFGLWSLPDRSSPEKKFLEDELDKAVAFYQGQIEQRHWYGFWDFGDVIHTYDPTRHEWRYDVGGQAWANTELMPNLWLWYTFLRTGRADVYRMAEAMTRQTQEVDVYHLGPMQGLGSRHNVRHWGDGAKEVRISQSLLKRPYYYLTTDERTADLMNEEINVDQKLVAYDPLRELTTEPKTKYPTHIRVGPDWFACVSNWLWAWEHTGDTKYRDYILTGMKCIEAMPHEMFTGSSFGYDPTTKMLYQIHDEVTSEPLVPRFGAPELNFELCPLLKSAAWDKVWLDYCKYLDAAAAEQIAAIGGVVNTGRTSDYARLAAYAAYVTKNSVYGRRAWDQFLHGGQSGGNPLVSVSDDPFGWHTVNGPNVPSPVDEISNISTNATSQWCLNAIELLELVPAQIPSK